VSPDSLALEGMEPDPPVPVPIGAPVLRGAPLNEPPVPIGKGALEATWDELAPVLMGGKGALEATWDELAPVLMGARPERL